MVSSSAVITIAPQTEDTGSLPLMLQPLLFSPAARWTVRALQDAGVERFLLLTTADLMEQAAACFPEGAQVCLLDDPEVDAAVRTFAAGETGEQIVAIDRPVWLSRAGAEILAKDDPLPTATRDETGICRVNARKLAANGGVKALRQGKPFAASEDDLPLAVPLTDCFDLLEAQEQARTERLAALLEDGVRVIDPGSVYLDLDVTVGAGTILLPNVILRGDTHIGANCEIGPSTMIEDCVLGDGCVARSSQLTGGSFGRNVNIGPFAYVRPGTQVADGCKVGDFVEVKNASLGAGTKLPHLIYVGDSDVGERCNFGCGSITCNYDGNYKYRTTVGDDVFIGCNTNLVAPVTVESGAYTAAGSTITSTVPADALAVARSRQELREGWALRHRAKKK